MYRDDPTCATIFIPCFNEEANIEPLYRRVADVVSKWSFPVEILYTDNGSTDRTLTILESIAAKDSRVHVLVMSRNFGYQGAISAGLAHATGDIVMVMDGDQQDPPELLPRFIEEWKRGAMVVYGSREKRDAPFFRKIGYKLFYRIIRALSYIDIPRDASDFALMDRRIVDILNAMPERDRFIRGLRAFSGFRQVGVSYDRPERGKGVTSFRFRDYLRFAYRSIFSYSYKPLELVSLLAVFTMVIACIGTVFYLALYFAQPNQPRGFATLILAILFFGGIQLFSLAIIGEYIGRIFEEVKKRPIYIIDRKISSHQEHQQGVTLTDQSSR
ncbi:MAG: glycosyltransferase family 2 protein [Candidatus Uhrbacteria bacterium]|nr:glycosyltransferase family 2 protein [Candidatus Uhrbacteria bacterium]